MSSDVQYKWCYQYQFILSAYPTTRQYPKGRDQKVNMNRLLPLIRSKLGAHPTLTNCVYYGSLFCAAEVCQQFYIRKYLPKKQVS